MTATSLLPPSRVADPRKAPSLRWGVLGTGWIAERFITALHEHTGQRMVAVASRDSSRAAHFARRLGIPRSCGDYRALVDDPEVDVVYVATPHNMHRRDALLAIDAGKHTLVEKPIALDAAQATEIASAARAAGLFCMEALWTMFLPKYDVVRQVLAEGMLGDLKTAILDHGEWFDSRHRIFRPDLAGGCLLDLATYTVAVADDILGPADAATATAEMTPSGVEGQVSAIVRHTSGAEALHHSTILTDTPVRAVLAGTDGTLVMEPPFWGPGRLSVHFHDGRADRTYDEPAVRHQGLFWQAAEVARRVGAGERESGYRPLTASIRCLQVLDDIRAAAGVPRPPA